jgi:hypothetical protein
METTIGTTEAAFLLGICIQRVRQLLYQGRIRGAKKIGRFWQIPLYKGMPKISNGTRGPSSRWRKSLQRTATIIHVNRQLLRKNQKDGERIPPIIVKRGSKTTYCHEVEVVGASRLVYRPEERKCNGAIVWLEIDPSISVKTRLFA